MTTGDGNVYDLVMETRNDNMQLRKVKKEKSGIFAQIWRGLSSWLNGYQGCACRPKDDPEPRKNTTKRESEKAI